MSKLAKRCIASWRKYCPNYEIKRWTEKDIDVSANLYAKQAYMNRKWAFVSDYARLKILFEEGGIYLDTDVELVRPLDGFLEYKGFSGFEGEGTVPTGLVGAVKGNKWIERLLKDYEGRVFIDPAGKLNLTTNVQYITNATEKFYGIKLSEGRVSLPDVEFYPSHWFCAKSLETRSVNITANTHAIHHFSGSWLGPIERAKIVLSSIIGKKGMVFLSSIKRKILAKVKK